MKEEDFIFDFIYSAAVGDATKQKAYEGEKKWIATVKGAKVVVKEYIDCLLDKNKQLDYAKHEELFAKTVKDVSCSISEAAREKGFPSFTFGNAQKLVNMTAKFFYIVCYKDETLKERFKFCHCPMDNFMLEQVWKSRKNLKNFEYKQKEKFVGRWSKLDFENNSEKTESWIIPKRYMDFQNAVSELSKKEEKLPIEYDYVHWKK